MTPSSSHAGHCSRCGQSLVGTALVGNCPACLARRLLEAEPDPDPAGETEPVLQRLGDYELIEELARGGMGVVFRARQVSLNRLVAVKLMRDGRLASAEEVRRFRAEAANAAQLNHPHIVVVHEAGEDDGQPFLVMDLVEGRSLADLTRNGPLPVRQAAQLTAAVADAVQHAHERGVIHRDLKPSNVLMAADGQPRVTDFGLARPIEGECSLTLTGQVLGTPGYLAPEQARGEAGVGPTTDVYGVGAILYHLLTGRAPFVGAGPVETMTQVLQQDPVSLRLLNSSVPVDLAAVCQRCLAKEPHRRYASASELAEDLHRFLRGEPTHARPLGAFDRFALWCRRKPALAAAMIALHIVGLAGFSGIVWQWRSAVEANARAQIAVRDKQEQLWNSQLIDAKYYRTSGHLGQRAKTLEIVREAAAYRPSLPLRNEAIAALLLPDLGKPLWFREAKYGHWPLAFTGDFDFYSPFSSTGQVAVIRVADHQVVTELAPGAGHTLFLKFSPDDRYLGVHFQDGAVRVWDWRTGRLAAKVPPVADTPGASDWPAFGFSPDGRECLIGCRGRALRRFELASGRELVSPLPASERMDAMLLHPRGTWLATVLESRVRLWEGGLLRDTMDMPDRANTLAWHPHEPWLAVGALGHSMILKQPGQPPVRFPAENARFTWIGFSPDGDLVITGGHGGTALWDVANRQPVLTAPDGFARQVSRDGRLLAFGHEGVGFGVRPVEWPTGLRRLVVPAEFGTEASASRFSRDGRWLATGHPRGLLLWDPETARIVARRATTNRVMPAAFLPGDVALLTDGEHGAQCWPLERQGDGAPTFGEPEFLFPPEWRSLHRIALASDDRTLAAGGEDGLVLTMLEEPREFVRLAGPERPVHYPAFSPDRKWLLTGFYAAPGIEIYDVEQRRHVQRLPTGGGHFVLSPGGDHLFAHSATHYGYWQVSTWTPLLSRQIEAPGTKALTGAGFAAGGRLMFCSDSAGWLQLRRVADDTPVATLAGFESTAAWAMTSSPDGRWLADSSTRNAVHLWEPGVLLETLRSFGLDWSDDPKAWERAPAESP